MDRDTGMPEYPVEAPTVKAGPNQCPVPLDWYDRDFCPSPACVNHAQWVDSGPTVSMAARCIGTPSRRGIWLTATPPDSALEGRD